MKTTAGALASIAAALLCCFGVSFLAAVVRTAGPAAGHRYNAFERARRPLDPAVGGSQPSGSEPATDAS